MNEEIPLSGEACCAKPPLPWARWSAVLVASTLGTGLVNFLFGLFVARLGGESTWSAVSPLLAAGTAGSFAGLGIEYAVTRSVIRGETAHSVVRRMAPLAALLGSVLVGSLVVASPLASFLHLASATPVPLCVALFDATVLLAVPSGLLVGTRRIGMLALVGVVAALVRVGLLWVVPGALVERALVCSIVAIVLAAVGMLVVATRQAAAERAPAEVRDASFGSLATSGSIARLALWVTVVAPVAIARHFLPLRTAGELATVTFIASSLAYTVAPIATAFFPVMLADKHRRHLRNGLAISLGLVVLGAGVIVPVGPSALQLLYHTTQPHLTLLLLVGCVGVLFQIGSGFLVWAALARNSAVRAVHAAAFGSLPLVGLLFIFHSSPAALLAAALPSTGAIGLISQLKWRRRERASDPPGIALYSAATRASLASLVECSVGVMAHNEELTIVRCLRSLLDARDNFRAGVREVIVIVSGTDRTEALARLVAVNDPRVRVLRQAGSEGKAAAINEFLAVSRGELLVVSSADVVLGEGMLAELVAPLADPRMGMCGGTIVPTNHKRGLCNRLVHLTWQLHGEVAAIQPKLGEVVAFRRSFERMDEKSSVDEVSIEECVTRAGLALCYVPAVRVYNHGPTKFSEFFRHRYRINRGHQAVRRRSGYTTATLSVTVVLRGTVVFLTRHPQTAPLLFLAALLELTTRLAARAVNALAGAPRTGRFERLDSAKVALSVVADREGS